MDRNDRQAIDGLFDRLADVERQGTPRDPEADAFIEDRIARQPGAPYYMAQTIVMQEQALSAAEARIAELEAASRRSSGGLLSGLFGTDQAAGRSRGSVPRTGRPMRSGQSGAFGEPRYGGGGFLAGAAQTAMGVAGGVLLANAVAGMLAPDEAEAAEPPAEDPGADDPGFDDGGDFGDIGF